jgi:branched-chain amino acid transport system substrate-binding protein
MNKGGRSRFIAGVLVCTSLAAAACGSNGGDDASERSSPQLEIKVGALYPITGTNASAGEDTLNGVKLAAQILNGEHPDIDLPKMTVGRVVLEIADTAGNPETGAADVDRLVGSEKVAAIVGAYQSAVTLTASQRAERYGVPFITGTSSSTTLTQRGLKWFFRTGPSDLIFAETYFAWLRTIADAHPVERAVILHTNDTFGNDGADVIKQVAADNGTTIVDDISFPPGAADLTSQVQNLRRQDPDAVFVLMFTNDAVLFTNTLATLGYTPPAILAFGAGYSDPAFVTSLGAKADYSITRAAWALEIGESNPVAKAVAEEFEKQFGQPMSENSAREFTALMTLGAAIESAGSTDAEKLRTALRNVDIKETIMPWAGVKFDSTGQNTLATGVIEQLISGQYRVLYPSDVGTATVTWPAPPLDER